MRTLGRRSVSSFLTVLLNVAWYAAAFFLALAMCLALVSPFVRFADGETSIPVSFSVDAQALSLTAPSLGVDKAQLEGVRGLLRFPLPNGNFVGAAVTLTVLFAVVLWVLTELRAVFRTLRDGQPFVPANATRIRRIAWAIIVGELARTAVVYSSNAYAMTHFTAAGLRFDARPDLDVLAIICGLIILVIAEVFRAGTRLDEDQSLTV